MAQWHIDLINEEMNVNEKKNWVILLGSFLISLGLIKINTILLLLGVFVIIPTFLFSDEIIASWILRTKKEVKK